MRIREIHVDRFGIFSDKHITGLKMGINLLYGPNEVGKTTLLEFVRRILFGFPRRSPNTNPYPPPGGGANGGRLICDLDNGETGIIIERSAERSAGTVTITRGEEQLTGQEELNKLLGNTSRALYEKVYAFSLEELQEVGSLKDADVQSRIYSAGLGLGSISPGSIRNDFIRDSESIFKPSSRSRSQVLPALSNEIKVLQKEIKEIQQLLSVYDQLVAQRNQGKIEVAAVESQVDQLRALEQRLESKRKLYPSYLELAKAQAALARLEELPEFSETVLAEFDECEKAIESLGTQIADNEQKIKALEAKKEGLTYNQEILKREPDIIDLQKSSKIYRDASRDIGPVSSKRDDQRKKIEAEIEKLGKHWSQQTVRDFQLSHLQFDQIRSTKAKLDAADKQRQSAKDKLDWRKEEIAAASGSRLTIPRAVRYALFSITGLGLVGSFLGIRQEAWPLTILSIIVLLLGLFIMFVTKGGPQAREGDLEKRLTDSLKKSEEDYKHVCAAWDEFLDAVNFDQGLTPEGALETLTSIQNIKSELDELDDRDCRILDMQGTIDQVKELHDDVTRCVDKSLLSSNIITNIDIMGQQLSECKDKKQAAENIAEQIGELAGQNARLINEKSTEQVKKTDCLSSLGASDDADFWRKREVWEKRQELEHEAEECTRLIELTVGTGPSFDEFIESIESATPEQIELELEEAQSRLEHLKDELTQKNRLIGELETKIKSLSSCEDLIVKQNEIELRKQRVRDYAKEWIRARIAAAMVEEAIAKYESTRQPAVIKAAGSIFRRITGNKYAEIRKPVEEDELIIIDESGKRKRTLEMSRGTKEQLYLAMRLGLIQEYESQSESLPLIMDDILVNFDDDRGPRAIETLQEFAKNRQVIVLTCHKNSVAIYRQLSANEVSIS